MVEIPDAPPLGELVGHLEIPSIGVSDFVVEGDSLDVLQDGPGHNQLTPLPGQEGNAFIAGHRTTYGQPFHNLDKVDEGDTIVFTYATGATFEYRYTGTEIVEPHQVEILDDFGDNRITLMACHPKYSAAQRIVVTGELITEAQPAPQSPRGSEARQLPTEELETIDGERPSKAPAVLWGIAAGSVWLAAWAVARVWRRIPTYLACLPVFLVVLFVFFENFSRLLPAAY